MQTHLSDQDYRLLAEFRYLLRQFLALRKASARKAGLTPQQHQALLAIRAADGGVLSTSQLAERLAIKVHSAVELTGRLSDTGLLKRQTDAADRRRVLLSLTPKGGKLLEKLTLAHRDELAAMAPLLSALAKRFRKKG
jgi:DNA-binding MarR family transcriptional regulator